MGAKTGLTPDELRKAAKFGLFGLIALVLTALTACFKNGKTAFQPAEPPLRTSNQQQPQTLQNLVDSMDKSTGTVNAPASDKCGPYPGYPCGTRYYTVSARDFNN